MLNDTNLCVTLKTRLQHDTRLRVGVNYVGVLHHDAPSEANYFDDDHYTFSERNIAGSAGCRNFRLFDGQHITMTLRGCDGRPRLNFKSFHMDDNFDIDAFADAIGDEVRKALKGYKVE